VATVALVGSAKAASSDQKTVAAQIKTMTGGAQTKIAWCRSVDGRMDYLGPIFKDKQDKTWVVMVFDTEEGRERVFAPASTPDAYCLPLITPNGDRLIWTRGRQDIFIADWNGRNARLLLHGLMAKGVAEDPPGTEWVYVGEDEDPAGSPGAIYRYQIDKPFVKQLVWNKTGTGMRFEVSRDGKWAVSEFGGNNCALAEFPNGNLQVFGQGCNSGLVFDGSFRTFHTLGGHTGIQVQDKGGANGRYIKFDDAPGRNGANVEWWWPSGFHWDGRFFVMSGPWAGPRHDRGNIIVGQFNESLTGVKQWVRVTDIPQSETYCYAWLAPAGQALRNAFGPSPTDKLTVKLLAATVRKFAGSDPFKPTLDELEKAAADGANAARAAEAKRIIDHILGWGRHALQVAQGQEATDLPAAVKTYKVLATNYAGLDIGDEAKKKLDDPGLAKDLEAWPKTQTEAAQKLETENPPEAEAAYKAILEKFPDSEFAKTARARLDDPGFKRQLTAWAHLKTIQKAEALFVTVPGTQAQASDRAWGGRNAARLSTVRSAARILKKDFADTAAWKEAEKVLQKYGIDVDKK
jgi:nucleotide-binding universal stress UspA family protein